MTKERLADLWLLVKFGKIENVFELSHRNKPDEIIGLYHAMDDEGAIDFDGSLNFVNYDKSIDAIKPIALKVIEDLYVVRQSELNLVNPNIIFTEPTRHINDIRMAVFILDIEKIFNAVVNGVKYLNSINN